MHSAAWVGAVLALAGTWIADRLASMALHARNRVAVRKSAAWSTLMGSREPRATVPAASPASAVSSELPVKGAAEKRKAVSPGCSEPAWKKRSFQLDPVKPFDHRWLEDDEFKSWAYAEGGCVRCSVCEKAKVNSKFTREGKPINDRWDRSQLGQHATIQKHKDAILSTEADVLAARALRGSRLELLRKMRTMLLVVMRTVYWLCVENVAMLKLKSLYCMIRGLPGSSFSSLPDNYINASRCREFVMSLSAVVKSKQWKDILASPSVSLLIDESTDISTSENMILCIIYICDKRPKTVFVGLEHCPATDAASIHALIVEFFSLRGLSMSKLAAFCSDGASVMTGSVSGVGVRLQGSNPFLVCIHCIAHRLALACADSANDMDYPEEQEKIFNHASSFFNRSGKKTHELRTLTEEMNICLKFASGEWGVGTFKKLHAGVTETLKGTAIVYFREHNKNHHVLLKLEEYGASQMWCVLEKVK
jgi:hypothetical protein